MTLWYIHTSLEGIVSSKMRFESKEAGQMMGFEQTDINMDMTTGEKITKYEFENEYFRKMSKHNFYYDFYNVTDGNQYRYYEGGVIYPSYNTAQQSHDAVHGLAERDIPPRVSIPTPKDGHSTSEKVVALAPIPLQQEVAPISMKAAPNPLQRTTMEEWMVTYATVVPAATEIKLKELAKEMYDNPPPQVTEEHEKLLKGVKKLLGLSYEMKRTEKEKRFNVNYIRIESSRLRKLLADQSRGIREVMVQIRQGRSQSEIDLLELVVAHTEMNIARANEVLAIVNLFFETGTKEDWTMATTERKRADQQFQLAKSKVPSHENGSEFMRLLRQSVETPSP